MKKSVVGVKPKKLKKKTNVPNEAVLHVSSNTTMAGPRKHYFPKLIDQSHLTALRSFHTAQRSAIQPFDCRTVNSIADNTSRTEEPEEAPRVRHRKRKAEPIDSEVELFKKKDKDRIPMRFSDIHPKLANKESRQSPSKLKNKDGEVQSALASLRSSNMKRPSIKETISPLQSPPGIAKESSQLKKITEAKISGAAEEMLVKYPVLKDQELVNKFLRVSLNNNQKGRIRQVIKEVTKGAPPNHLPDVLNNRIQVILRSSDNLTDTDLRKIRILYNMLNTVTVNQKLLENVTSDATKKKKEKGKKEKNAKKDTGDTEQLQKPKKRYVVFVGNLPKNVTKEQILEHFADLGDFVKSVRIPNKKCDEKTGAIAYVELSTGTSFEMALSKHHSMFGNRRINVLYSAPKDSKMTKSQAKGKAAKLTAMAKNGQLVGSIPLTKKRSHRRAKARQARKAAEEGRNV